MSKTYIQIGTYNDNSQDHHKEMTVNVSGNTSVNDLVRTFFSDAEDVTPEPTTPTTPAAKEELFHFIHPSVIDEPERRKISAEVHNLVRDFPLPEICRHLRHMKEDSKVYLNVKPDLMFDELHRMGMPDESVQGFSKKNFMNYFNINE